MTSKLDLLTRAARSSSDSSEGDAWSDARSDRVLSSIILRQEKRAVRSRIVRRSAGALSVAAVLVFVLLRGGATSPANASAPSSAEQHDQQQDQVLAAHTDLIDRSGDGGYGRD